MNTRIQYLYRDADNYKVHNECVVEGEFDRAQIQEMLACCDCGEYFIPRQVGLPEKQFENFDPAVDHCWFELAADGFEATPFPATVALTAQQLVKNFKSCQDHWNASAPNLNEITAASPNELKTQMDGMT